MYSKSIVFYTEHYTLNTKFRKTNVIPLFFSPQTYFSVRVLYRVTVKQLSGRAFFTRFAELLATNPPNPKFDGEMVESLRRDFGIEPGAEFDCTFVPRFREELPHV